MWDVYLLEDLTLFMKIIVPESHEIVPHHIISKANFPYYGHFLNEAVLSRQPLC